MSAPSPASVTVTPGGAQGSYNLTFQALNGFSNPVNLSYSGVPNGLSLSPGTLIVSGNSAIVQPVSVSAAGSTKAGTYYIGVTASGVGTGGTITQGNWITVVVTAPPSFTLTIPLSPINVSNNLTLTHFPVSINAVNGFNGQVLLQAYQYRDLQGIHPLPVPAYVSFGNIPYTPDPVTGTANVAGLIQSPPGATPGTYYYDCEATSGSLPFYPFTLIVVVNGSSLPADFSLSSGTNVVPVSVGTGSAASFQELVLASNAAGLNWAGSVNLNLSGWPSGVTPSVTPATFSSIPATLNFSVSASSGATMGSFSPTITVKATDPSTNKQYQHTIPIALTVGALPTFTLTASPSSQNANSQGLASYQLNVVGANGFNDSVSFSAVAPTGYTASFTPSAVKGTGTTVMTVTSPPVKTPKTLSLTAMATSKGGISQTAPLQVTPNLISNPTGGVITYPSNGETISVCDPVFIWDPGNGPSQYQLTVGTTPGGANVYNASFPQVQHSAVVPLFKGGGNIYVTLASDIDNGWVYNSYSYSSNCGETSPTTHPIPYKASPFSPVTLLNNSPFNANQTSVDVNYTTYADGDPQYFTGCWANKTGNPYDHSGVDLGVEIANVLNTRQFTVRYFAFDDLPAGNYAVFCTWEDPDPGISAALVPLENGVTIYDGTPVITSIEQLSQLTPGGQADIAISGENFGTVPTPLTFYTCTNGGDTPSGCSQTGDITSFAPSKWTPERIEGTVYLSADAGAPQDYYLSITSKGAGGDGNGFQQGNPASQPVGKIKGKVSSSQSVTVTVFLVHGINQSSSDVKNFTDNLKSYVASLQSSGSLPGVAFAFNNSFDFGVCKSSSCSSDCSIENGADLLASHPGHR